MGHLLVRIFQLWYVDYGKVKSITHLNKPNMEPEGIMETPSPGVTLVFKRRSIQCNPWFAKMINKEVSKNKMSKALVILFGGFYVSNPFLKKIVKMGIFPMGLPTGGQNYLLLYCL